MTAAHNTLELIEARREIVRLKEELARAQAARGTAGPSDHAGLVERLRMHYRAEPEFETLNEAAEAIAALSRAPEAEPVAEVIWYDPRLYDTNQKPHKIIDASMGFMDQAPIGTKLYATPPAPQPALALIEEDEVDLGWIQTATVLCERLGIEPKADAHHIVCGIEKLKSRPRLSQTLQGRMTMDSTKALDPKALEAAARVYAKGVSRNPDECAFGHGWAGEGGGGFKCDVTWLEACTPSAAHVIRTYIAALASQGEAAQPAAGWRTMLQNGFMTCVSSRPDYYVKVQFKTLKEAQDFHAALIAASPDGIASQKKGSGE